MSIVNNLFVNNNAVIVEDLDVNGTATASSIVKSGGTNIQYLMADGSTLTQSATSGNSNFYLYNNTNSTTNINPASGDIIVNSVSNSTATIVYISHVTRDNIDVEVFWKFVNTLTELYLQDQSLSTNFIQYNIIAPPTITVGNKIAIPVAVFNSAGTGATSFGAGHNILVSYFINNLETDTRLSGLEQKTQNITATALATSNNGTFTSGSLAVSNGTSSTLITTTSGTAALPLILPAIQATTGQILQGSSTGQTSWVSASSAITDTTQRWISSAIGNDTTGTGTLSAPWATIAKGFTTAQYPLKLNIRGSFIIPTLVLTSANSNTQITTGDGYEAQQSTVDGEIQTTGTMTRLKCSGLNFSSPTYCLIFDDTQGRHVFDNCAFNSSFVSPIFVNGTFTNWLNFNNCDFTGLTGGTLYLATVGTACILRLYNCGVVSITIGTNWTVYISGSTVLVSPSAILGTVIQLPVEQFNAVITTQAAFNAISVDGLYINQVVGLTGLTGATFGCSFQRAGAVKLISLGYNSLPASINVFNSSTFNYDSYNKNSLISGGWILSGSSGGGNVDYLHGAITAATAILAVNATIPFTTVTTSGGITNTSGVFSLTAGKTYNLMASCGTSTNSTQSNYQWKDITNNILIGNQSFMGINVNPTQTIAQAIYTALTNVTVALTNAVSPNSYAGTIAANLGQSTCSIVQISSGGPQGATGATGPTGIGNVSATGVTSATNSAVISLNSTATSIGIVTTALQKQSFAISVGGISYFTSTERDSLSWILSDIIYNRSYFRLERYNGTYWVSADGTVGQLGYFNVTTAPQNYQIADGSLVSRSGVYLELWTLNISVNPTLTPITCTIAISASALITKLAHGLTNSQRVRFTTTGTLPTGIVVGTDYIVTVISTSTFRLSTTISNALNGTFLTTSGTQSGVQSYTNTLYGQGNGTTTQTVLDGRGLFLRGNDPSLLINNTTFNGNGSLQGDAIRNITGQFNCGFENAPNPSGCFTQSGDSGDGVSGNGLYFTNILFNASNVVPTDDENRPKQYTSTIYIKYL